MFAYLGLRPPPPPTFQHAPQAFFLQVYNCSVDGQGKCDLDKGALWPKPVKVITAVSGNVDQSKLDSQIGPYILCILIKSQQKATQMLRREHSTWPLGDTYQVQMSGAQTK